MKTLIYVPIIHNQADMGSVAKHLYQQKLTASAEKRQQKHIETVNGYWNTIENFFNDFQIPENGVKIFQDGMFADGKMALTILEEGIKSGSKNSVVVQNLINRGATLIKTEDFKLVKKEYDGITSIIKAKNSFTRIFFLLKYKILKPAILRRRDKFIALTIANTLHEGETGVIFIGAYHNIIGLLPSDILVTELRETTKIKKLLFQNQ